MRNLKRKTSLLALAFLVSIAVSAQQYGNGNGKNNGEQKGKNAQQCTKQNKGERMAQYLELTDEQQTQIDALRLSHQKTMLPMKNELGEQKAKMKTLQTATPADMKAINSLIDDMSSVKAKMQKDRASMHQELRKVLTEDQRVKFDMHSGKKGARGQGKGYGKRG